MRQLSESELFRKYLSPQEINEIFSTLNTKLRHNTGIIRPENIELELIELKKRAKNNYVPLAGEAISMYETMGHRIRLFNLQNGGASPIPAYIPFLPDLARNYAVDPELGMDANTPAVFVNMYRIGNWSADGNDYNGLRAVTDLYSCLESGLIAYKMICEKKWVDVLSNKVVLENLTRIYTRLFTKAVVKVKVPFGSGDFADDAGSFIISKFFLKYVLKKQDSDILDDYAYLAIPGKSSLPALKNYEDSAMIDYDSLSGFLKTLGENFFHDPISLPSFINSWLSQNGEGMLFAIEYVPYFIHFLFAAIHQSMLGGSIRLQASLSLLQDWGLNKLYNAVINLLR